jgi:starch-binding outer membrane protein, SusD/RagB family
VQTLSLTRRAAALAVALSVFGACKDSTGVPELNNISTDAIANGLDRASTKLILTGLLDRDRGSVDQRYMVFSATMARDIYRLDSAEPRYVTEILVAAPDAGGFVGGSAFTNFFNAIRTANTLIDNLPTTQRAELAPQFQLSDQEIAGVRGVARTIKAQAFYRAIEMRDTLGIPIDVDRPVGSDLASFVCKKNVLGYIAALLDSAQTDLAAAGSSFYFPLPAGFTAAQAGVDFTTPASFTKYNRALKGKVELYRGLNGDATAYARALTALNASYLDTAAPLNNGPVYTYSAAPGETTNPTFDNNIFANPKAKAALQTGDTRAAKFATGSSTRYGFTGSPRLAMTRTADASNQTRPRRILSNEELILLRAQVEIEQANWAGATADINAVRTQYGLAPIALLADAQTARTALLYEKRYSLFFEGAQRVVDLRAYGRFNATYLTPESANGSTDPFVSMLPIPKSELDQRGGSAPKTCS